jgi:hypothetical protein
MTNNNYIEKKRESLCSFIHDQLIGPGAYGYKFGMDGAEDKVEILDVTPGSIYCSGILFPKKKKCSASRDSSEGETDGSIEMSDREEDSNDDETTLYDEEDIKQLTQRYPDSFGISCCLGKDSLTSGDFSVLLSGRYYTKVAKSDLQKLFVTVEEHYLRSMIELLSRSVQVTNKEESVSVVALGDYFVLKENHLHLSTTNNALYSVIQGALNSLEKEYSRSISSQRNDEVVPDSGLLLATYKERVYERLCGRRVDRADEYMNTIRLIEEKQTVLSYFRDLLPILSITGFGFWRSHDFSFDLNLSKVDFSMEGSRMVIKPTKENGLKDIILKDKNGQPLDSVDAKLSIWLQLTKDSRNSINENTYLKVLVENTSSPFEETPKRYYSIVTEGVNAKAFFGVKIDIHSRYFVPYQLKDNYDSADEEQSRLRLLYRKIEDYGSGHRCSVDWEPRKATHVWSEFMPKYDSPDVDVVPQRVVLNNEIATTEKLITNTECLQFKRLSTLSNVDDDEIRRSLLDFADAYRRWIDSTLVSSDSTPVDYVNETKEKCLGDYNRLKNNIQDLLSNPEVMLSFRLMNTAMYMQLWHSSEDNKQIVRDYGDYLDEEFYRQTDPEMRKGKGPAAWRPFQLAFIIMNLDGLVRHPNDQYWEKRNKQVDLVWFPTGGGKTEAYLGIIAFAILYRRRTHKKSEGTTAIMRYTLRLLATQQFQRALRLILALEQIRKWDTYNLGGQINIGLYVGSGALPNKWSDTPREKGLKTEGLMWNNDRPSKIPFEKKVCPWCGASMEWSENKKTLVCVNGDCIFNDEGLPVLLCDEHIYKTPPTLLFGTVDKFAAIAHKVSNDQKDDSRRLFHLNNLTPDLIIQDELHLLEGPLGSAVGLFENAVDTLSERRESDGLLIRPKIISSTATTRNTELQIRALYDRGVSVFPKSGIDFDDSFFAFYKRNPNNAEEYDSKRRYIGILPTGRTSMYTQIRLAACCFTHRALFERDFAEHLHEDDFITAADYYYTLVSYFNSKKDVGNTDAQFSTEFPKYTRQVFHRVLRHELMLECFYALNQSFSNCELTGRLNGPQIVKSLGEVQKHWHPDLRLPHRNAEGELEYGTTPPDFVLATNMISVGIDVSRFNLMIVNSMPRNKSEYIQASSRVARDELGIVFTLHNPYRARDLSHFERFREFHEKMYFYVDPISITPYSPQAVEKYMPAVLAALVRHEFSELATDGDVASLTEKMVVDIKRRVSDLFLSRMESIRNDNNPLLRELFPVDGVQMIDDFVSKALEEWMERKETLDCYDNPYKSPLFLSLDAYEEEKAQTLWSVPYSLREIAESSVINIKND